jgi:hypothetical protein
MKAVLRGKLIALSTFKKKVERAYSSSLTAALKALKQKDANIYIYIYIYIYIPKRSRPQEIVKHKAEINQVETKQTI